MADNTNTTITEKLIETRIINRHDTLANWNDSQLTLKEGEIALAYVENEVVKTDKDGNTIRDSRGNIVKEVVPTYLMKIGHKKDGKEQSFSELPFLAAPASDVFAWAKDPQLAYSSLPTELVTAVEDNTSRLSGINGEGGVLTAISAAIDALDSTTTTGQSSDGEVPVAVAQQDGTVTVKTGYITNANIASAANISMSKVENLTPIYNDIYGYTSEDDIVHEGIKSKVQALENRLGDQGRVMEFVGTYKSTKEDLDKHTTNGYFVPASNSATAATKGTTGAIQLQKGDVVAIVSGDDAGKEYIWSSINGTDYAWEELGHAGATDEALAKFAEKVLIGGLGSKRLSGEAGAATKTLEQEFLDRTLALEYEVGITDDKNESTTSLKDRTTAIENKLDNNVPQLDGNNNILKIAQQVLIFDCGTSAAREYLGE